MNTFWSMMSIYESNSIHQLYVNYNVLLCYKQIMSMLWSFYDEIKVVYWLSHLIDHQVIYTIIPL